MTAPKTTAANADPANLPQLSLGGLKPTALLPTEKVRPLLSLAALSSSPKTGVRLMATDSYALGLAQLADPAPNLPTCTLLVPRLSMLALEVRGGQFTIRRVDDTFYACRSFDGSLWPLSHYGEPGRPKEPIKYDELIPPYRESGGVNHPAVGLGVPLERLARWANGSGLALRLQYPESPIKPVRFDLVRTSANDEAEPADHVGLVMPVRMTAGGF